MDISLNGYGEKAATFKAQSGVAAGLPVKMTANGTVGACSDGDAFCGIALNVRGGYCAVQLSGYANAPYTGSPAPAVGYQTLSAGTGGSVKAATTGGRSILVTDVDTASKKCGFIL